MHSKKIIIRNPTGRYLIASETQRNNKFRYKVSLIGDTR